MPASDRADGGGPSNRPDRVVSDAEFDHQWLPGEIRLGEARTALRAWLATHAPAVDHDAALLIATELLTNARDASEPDEIVGLRVVHDDRGLEIVVENTGNEFVPSAGMPEPMSTRGRGLAIVGDLATSLHVDRVGPVIQVGARLDNETSTRRVR